ncbi:hypothetical protein H312_00359 [Anncaliia algerae PRA339]|uniref:Transcription factor CBF/NF-Y/archaeal histone domain-containing protein n=1 Tax=Anncaliia algerae PRA339 TaxID=1288291 RepID=A0A059F5T4_9MICR|nr:hypothetical protein H312_00359 [Anncaliia algerae PRA339]
MKNIEIKNQESPICSQFWGNKNEEIESNENFFLKHDLPLARIKKLMRVEEDVKNIGGEVTPLFSKITQTFIEEVTIKALDKAYNRKKRIIQKSDINDVFSSSEIYDFLHFLIPFNNHKS